jgi:hypothetical protein
MRGDDQGVKLIPSWFVTRRQAELQELPVLNAVYWFGVFALMISIFQR